jgi:hypothetical protein
MRSRNSRISFSERFTVGSKSLPGSSDAAGWSEFARVLLIGDEDVVREVLAELQREAGHEVFELPSPIDATRTIISEGIDTVVLDVSRARRTGINLPGAPR